MSRSKQLVYLVGFSSDEISGRGEGTRKKKESLGNLLGERFTFIDVRLKIPGRLFNYILKSIVLSGGILKKIKKIRSKETTLLVRDFPLIALFKKIFGISYCAEIHAATWEETGKRGVQESILKWAMKMYYSNAEKVIFNNSILENYYKEEFGSNRSFVSYNAGSIGTPPKFVSRSMQEAVRIVYAGSIHPWHGLSRAVGHLIGLLDANVNVEVIIVSGTATPFADVTISKLGGYSGVKIIRSGNKSVIMDAIATADYCFLPVLLERVSPGSPIKLFDYIFQGKNVITYENLPGYSDVCESVGMGVFIPYEPKEDSPKLTLTKSDRIKEGAVIRRAAKLHTWESRMKQWLVFLDLEYA